MADKFGVPRYVLGAMERNALFRVRDIETAKAFVAGHDINLQRPEDHSRVRSVSVLPETTPTPSPALTGATKPTLLATSVRENDALGIVRLLARSVTNEDVRVVLRLAKASGLTLDALAGV